MHSAQTSGARPSVACTLTLKQCFSPEWIRTRHFHSKKNWKRKIFWGRGTVPPRHHPQWEGNHLSVCASVHRSVQCIVEKWRSAVSYPSGVCLGQSTSRNRIWCIIALKYDIWWQQF